MAVVLPKQAPDSTEDLSKRKLSEVAKRIAIPRDIVSTDWEPVRDICRDDMGIEFDGWQDGLGTLLLSRNSSGHIAHTVGGFGLSAMRQVGKALDVSTELLTANRGWITMGDVKVGDQVFHPDGHAVEVVKVHAIMLDRGCYEVATTDGRKLVVDGEHLWTVQDKRQRRKRNMTTLEMLFAGLDHTGKSRFDLPRQCKVDFLVKDGQLRTDRIEPTSKVGDHFSTSIKSIKPVSSRPVRCIQVGSPDGLFLAGRDLVPTHNTYFFAGAFFGMAQEYPGMLAIWTAHHSRTHGETFLSMQAFAKRPQIAPYVRDVYTGSGDESVVFNNGSRILFGARERGFGRGIPGVDVLMSDEGQILSEKAVDSMLATLNTSSIGIHIYAGTPPKPEDNSEKWMRMRAEAWAIEDPSIKTIDTDDLVFVEIGADDSADLDDVQQWMKNPSCPHRTPLESIMRLRRNLKDDAFRREGLGIYDQDVQSNAFDLTRWKSLADTDAAPPEHAALVIDVSPDRRWSSIGIAGELEDGRIMLLVQSSRGTRGVVEKVKQLREERDIIDVAITNGAARALETDLVEESIDYEVLTASQMSAAYANLQEKIKADPPEITHAEQPELNFALANVKTRFLQTGEAESFDRREYTVDVSGAVAVAGALYRFGILNTGPVIIF